MLRYPTFTTAIYDQYRATFNGAGATMLAGVLVLLCLAPAAGRAAAARAARLRAHGRGAARPGPAGALRRAHRARRGRARGLVALSLVVPLASLGYWMAAGASTGLDWAC